MSPNYLNIEATRGGIEQKIKQNIKFKTGEIVWQIQFNTALNPKTINNVNLYVTTLNQNPLKTSIRYDTITNTIEIEPLEPYAENQSYILNVTTNVESKGGQRLKAPIQVQFKR